MTAAGSLIVHPSDPTAEKIGGIETFIRGYVKFAPSELDVRYVGVTTDPVARPIGSWSTVSIDGRQVAFLPVMEVRDLQQRGRRPIALRFTWALFRHRRGFAGLHAVIQFHRPGPALALILDARPKIQIVHLTAETDFALPSSESRWRRAPWLFRLLESAVLPRMSHIFIVNPLAVASYRRRFRRLEQRFEYISNWADDTVFYPTSETDRLATRRRLSDDLGIPPGAPLLLFVGRLEGIKDPDLMLRTFAGLAIEHPSARLLIVGDGTMRGNLVRRIADPPLAGRVLMTGGLAPPQVAELMNAAEALLLTSASEGMPIAVLEALACGLPVVSTDVGAVSQAVPHKQAGWIASQRTPRALRSGLEWVLASSRADLRTAAVSAAQPYRAGAALRRLYELHDADPSDDQDRLSTVA